MTNLIVVCTVISLLSLIASILVTTLVFKLYTEYYKDITIQRRYKDK